MRYLIVYILCLISFAAASQNTEVTTYSLRGFPVAFYLPETGLSAGGLGIFTFRVKQDTSICPRPSSIQIGAAYTSRNQILVFVPYELYLNNGAYRLQGELGYYRYQYNFFGLGPASSVEDLETYDVNFPRINVQLLKQLSDRWLLGVGVMYDYFDLTRIEENGQLSSERPLGVEGGSVSGPLAKLLYDSRDHLFDPHRGSFADVSVTWGHSTFGSTYDFVKYIVDLRRYWTVGADVVIAAQVTANYVSGRAPFFQYPYIGSGKQGRGIADRRYIARQVSTAQVEARVPVWKRWAVVPFFGFSAVSDGLFEDDDRLWVPAGGLGVRYILDQTELTRLRMDYGHSREGGQVYLTLNEAF